MPRGILVTDGYWRKTLAAVRALGRAGELVVVGERTHFSPALFSRHARAVVYPSPESRPEEFARWLREGPGRFGCDVVMPMEEDTLLFALDRRAEIPAALPFASAGLVRRAGDKAWTLARAAECGVPVPRTWTEPAAAEGNGPFVVKPGRGSGSRGLRHTDRAGLAAAWRPGCLVQEKVEGEGWGVSVLMGAGGAVLGMFTHRRLREYPTTGGPSTLRESARDRALEEAAVRLLRHIGWTGVAMVEFKKRPDGFHLMEINPRFWGSLALAVEAGVNFPVLLARWARGEEFAPVTDWRTGVRARVFFPGEVMHFLRNPDRGKMDPPLLDFAPRDDYFRRDDPAPGAGLVLSVLTGLFHREWRKFLRS
ncbi:MAG: ATP-grasp domain-containing protein [Planctomycetes bacterium]|nr:ATP-grasp domain-containing protein [Planctomycetota bacterium]